MKIWLGNPIPPSDGPDAFGDMLKENVKTMGREGTICEVKWLKSGYLSSSHAWTGMYNAIEGVKCYYEAWKTGYDAVVIGCIGDPGLTEARSLIDIPVAGVCQSAVLIASCLGNKFSIIVHNQALVAILTDNIRSYGMIDKLASVRCIDISAIEGLNAPAKLMSEFSEAVARIADEDEAEVIIPGCTITSSILTANKVHEIEKIPVIDPVWAGIKMAEVLVDLKQTYGTGVCRSGIYSAAAGWEKEIPISF